MTPVIYGHFLWDIEVCSDPAFYNTPDRRTPLMGLFVVKHFIIIHCIDVPLMKGHLLLNGTFSWMQKCPLMRGTTVHQGKIREIMEHR